MKYVGVYVLAAAAAVLWAGAARAERENERAGAGTGGSAAPPSKARPPPARPAMFAAGSVAQAKKMSPEQREERRFLKEAAATSRFESDASRLALTRSKDPGVRSFASTLVNHHASAGPALQNMLHGRGMAPPMLGNGQRKTLNRLAKLSGAKFDREYIQEVGLKQRQSDLQSYESASLMAREPALKAWIATTLPTLRYQLATAERIAATDVRFTVGPGARAAAGAARQGGVAQPKAKSQAPFASRDDAARSLGAGPGRQGE